MTRSGGRSGRGRRHLFFEVLLWESVEASRCTSSCSGKAMDGMQMVSRDLCNGTNGHECEVIMFSLIFQYSICYNLVRSQQAMYHLPAMLLLLLY
ncbi:hypothetical protein BDZ85DRAFT_10240 [Elsinoe ampelina]|uniref:Uncharacterized protein n=1 Tax=Elsinoe ampelina TaxID=302913 RepID=A0A6A6GRJ6_9PEZI|nr:hypothetical protein BDZ85DRAFT_10240 [Elsinoe ampelina]